MDQTLLESQFSNLSAGFKVVNIFLEVMETVNPQVIKSRTHFSKSNSSASYKLICHLQIHPLVVNSSASCKVIH